MWDHVEPQYVGINKRMNLVCIYCNKILSTYSRPITLPEYEKLIAVTHCKCQKAKIRARYEQDIFVHKTIIQKAQNKIRALDTRPPF